MCACTCKHTVGKAAERGRGSCGESLQTVRRSFSPCKRNEYYQSILSKGDSFTSVIRKYHCVYAVKSGLDWFQVGCR